MKYYLACFSLFRARARTYQAVVQSAALLEGVVCHRSRAWISFMTVVGMYVVMILLGVGEICPRNAWTIVGKSISTPCAAIPFRRRNLCESWEAGWDGTAALPRVVCVDS